MSKIKQLGRDTLIISVGNFGSKFMLFFMVPFYTYYLTPKDYGIADLLVVAISMFTPIVTLSIGDALLRFSVNHQEDRQRLFSTAISIPLVLLVVVLLLSVIAVLNDTRYFLPFIWLLWLQSLNVILLQYTRAIGKLMLFSTAGIISAVSLLVGSYLFLNVLSLTIVGYLYAQMLSTLISLLLLVLAGKYHRQFTWREIDRGLLTKMLRYSIPLVPNAVMWWVMLMSNRYVVALVLGATATGLFTVASKIPSVISMFHSTFMQAWHLAAIKNKEDQQGFFSTVFYAYFFLLSLIAISLLSVIRTISQLLFARAYEAVWQYIPFLLVGIIFLSLASFLEAFYIAEKKTAKLVKTTLIGTIANVSLTLALVPTIGLQGAGIAMATSFFLTWLLRANETKLWQTMSYRYEFVLTSLLLLVTCTLISAGCYLRLVPILIILSLFVAINSRFIKQSSPYLKGFLRGRRE